MIICTYVYLEVLECWWDRPTKQQQIHGQFSIIEETKSLNVNLEIVYVDITTSCKSCIFNAFQPSSIHANSSMPALFQHQLIASPHPPSTTGLHWKPISGNSVKATSWTIIRYFLISQISHLLTRNSSNVQKNLCRLPDPPVIHQRMKNLGLWPLPLPLLRPRPININIGRVALPRVFRHSREPKKNTKKRWHRTKPQKVRCKTWDPSTKIWYCLEASIWW